MDPVGVVKAHPVTRVGRFGLTQPARSDLVVAGVAAFIATLDLMLLPYAILSFIRLYGQG